MKHQEFQSLLKKRKTALYREFGEEWKTHIVNAQCDNEYLADIKIFLNDHKFSAAIDKFIFLPFQISDPFKKDKSTLRKGVGSLSFDYCISGKKTAIALIPFMGEYVVSFVFDDEKLVGYRFFEFPDLSLYDLARFSFRDYVPIPFSPSRK